MASRSCTTSRAISSGNGPQDAAVASPAAHPARKLARSSMVPTLPTTPLGIVLPLFAWLAQLLFASLGGKAAPFVLAWPPASSSRGSMLEKAPVLGRY